jgi:hypothetical protein
MKWANVEQNLLVCLGLLHAYVFVKRQNEF